MARQGTYLGTLEGVNHLDLVGWISTARYKWAELTGREIKFKPATFYLGVADHLARHVEGQSATEGVQDEEDRTDGSLEAAGKKPEDTTETSHAGAGVDLAESHKAEDTR